MKNHLLLLLACVLCIGGTGWVWYGAQHEDPRTVLKLYVRSGLFTRKAIIEIFSGADSKDVLGHPAEVGRLVDAELAVIREEQKEWPEVTDVRRLDSAFQALVSEGVLCIQNVGYSEGDGVQELSEIVDGFDDPTKFTGYCFFPLPELERAVAGDGLTITYGAFTGNEERAIADTIMRRLTENGLNPVLHPAERKIIFPTFDWKKRV